LNQYIFRSATSWNSSIDNSGYNTSVVPLQSTIGDPPPTDDLRKSVWSSQSMRTISLVDQEYELEEGERSTMKLQDKSLSTGKKKTFR
jgi:hypothetical protein